MKRIAYFSFVFALFGALAAAQTTTPPDQPSLGAYARKVQKEPAAKAKPHVFDNDNLPKEDKLSIVGPPVVTEPAEKTGETPTVESGEKDKATAAEGNKEAGAKPAAPGDEASKNRAAWKEWQDKLTDQKNQIDLAARELDVLQREYQLRAAAMYADVGNRMRNAAQWDKEEADYKQKIADKQKSLDEAKQKLTDMEEDARKAGVPAAVREQ